VPHTKVNNYQFFVIASDGGGWEHISVHVSERGKQAKRCPTWAEMCYIKDLFFAKDCTVLQYHPAEEDYVNMHPFCLHLWRPVGVEFPKPLKILV
jgi:hypothetical protein